MRPQRLEFEGFTAFRAPTVVDFGGAELFALTGATGSGKTSVLDAIVFALYGTVPRLADQRQVAPIVAQGMAEARVRLDFTVGPDAYTATRVVRRTKTGATTAEARLERDGEVLAGAADEVSAAVTHLLGLGYDHFTKCVVLPQGEFARFLHDKPKDRQDLLVNLLDLHVYGRMAELAGQRSSAAKRDAEVLTGRVRNLAGATEGAVASAGDRVERLSAVVAEIDAAAPELDLLATESAEATATAARLAAESVRLDAISIPDELVELHDRQVHAAGQYAIAEADARNADVARAAADSALAALPDRGELLLLREAHERGSALNERRTKGQLVVTERRADEAAAAESVQAAQALVAAAREAVEAVAAAHRAHVVRADLQVGEPCPVCLQRVNEVPDEKPPPALEATGGRLEVTERELRGAVDAHSAASHAVGVAEATLTQVVADLHDVEAGLHGRPATDNVLAALEAVDAARLTSVAAAKRADGARDGLRLATHERDVVAQHEQAARQRYDEVRDEVAALGPPARLGGDTALVGEWAALAGWAGGEATHRARLSDAEAAHAAATTSRRAERVTQLVARCHDEHVQVPPDTDPTGVPRQELGQALAEHKRLCAQLESAMQLRVELAAVESRRDVARALATHLDARHFEKWVLDEAMTALADGATELLGTLSGGQYALRVDAKSGSFVVVDHRNAGEVRSARTLSGGETFLASLALALALADRIAVLAARRAARLESIFLDEGFGTLDADTLDVVATAIEELGASGRLVGVVSHVADLAERLPVRFEVQRSANASTIRRVDR